MYTTQTTTLNGPNEWQEILVEILADGEKVGEYKRNYSLLDTFHPFTQDGKEYALYSSHYMYTRVMSLPDCVDLGGEDKTNVEYNNHFCPTGYYVPVVMHQDYEKTEEGKIDWKRKKGDRYDIVNGQLGFVSGCVWGDDSSWKIQYLDLSKVSDIKRDQRLGYLELAYRSSLQEAVRVEEDYEEGYSFEIDTTLVFSNDGTLLWVPDVIVEKANSTEHFNGAIALDEKLLNGLHRKLDKYKDIPIKAYSLSQKEEVDSTHTVYQDREAVAKYIEELIRKDLNEG